MSLMVPIAKAFILFARKLGKLRGPHITDWSLVPIAKAFILLGSLEN